MASNTELIKIFGILILLLLIIFLIVYLIIQSLINSTLTRVDNMTAKTYNMLAEITDVNRSPFENIRVQTYDDKKVQYAVCVQASVNKHFGAKIDIDDSEFIINEYICNQVLWMSTKDTEILAVRGTLTSQDMWTNLQAYQVPFKQYKDTNVYKQTNKELLVHNGFAERTYTIATQMHKFINKIQKNKKKVIFCGHSLGGAVAALLKLHFNPILEDVELYTYGMPRIGNHYAMKEIESKCAEFYNVVNACDLIPQFPTCVFPDIRGQWLYTHGSNVKYIEFQTGSWLGNHSLDNYINYMNGKTDSFIWSI